MDFTHVLQVLKEYGPILGPLVLIVGYQSIQINRLLDRLRVIQDNEIARLASVQDRLLTRLIGPQLSSDTAPDAKRLADGVKQTGTKTGEEAAKGKGEMDNLVIGLAAAALALGIQLLFLRSHRIWLKKHTQSYEFHALRDRLQLLAVERKIDQTSRAYGFLLFALNLSIKNAGRLKLRDTVALARFVDKRSDERQEALMRDIKRQGEDASQLAADTFKAFAFMLVKNDNVLYLICVLFKHMANHYTRTYPPSWRTIAKGLLGAPRVEALREVRKYNELSSKLCHSS